MGEETINSLSYDLEQTNKKLKDLSFEKQSIESRLINLIGKKDEGTTLTKTKFYKMTTTGKITRNFDKGFKLSVLEGIIGKDIAEKLAKPKFELNLSEYRKLTDKQLLAVSKCITSKPAKTSLKIERIEQGEPA